MTLQLSNLDFSHPSLSLSNSELDISEKRGNAYLYFDVFDGTKLIGEGIKHLILSGLTPFDQNKVDQMIHKYNDNQKMYARL